MEYYIIYALIGVGVAVGFIFNVPKDDQIYQPTPQKIDLVDISLSIVAGALWIIAIPALITKKLLVDT